MKGAGQPRDLDFDPTEDAQTMSVFEDGAGKEWLETRLADKLVSLEWESRQPKDDSSGMAA